MSFHPGDSALSNLSLLTSTTLPYLTVIFSCLLPSPSLSYFNLFLQFFLRDSTPTLPLCSFQIFFKVSGSTYCLGTYSKMPVALCSPSFSVPGTSICESFTTQLALSSLPKQCSSLLARFFQHGGTYETILCINLTTCRFLQCLLLQRDSAVFICAILEPFKSTPDTQHLLHEEIMALT